MAPSTAGRETDLQCRITSTRSGRRRPHFTHRTATSSRHQTGSRFARESMTVCSSNSPVKPSAVHALRALSTFSRDIAYPRSPAAPRASSRVQYSRPRSTFPSRTV
jgi:hypothetical protein